MALSFRARLMLVHQAVIVVVLTTAGLAGYWSLSRAVHEQLDGALLALAETEVGMLGTGDTQPVRVHETPPGPAPPSFERLDRLVQIVDDRGRVVARSANLGGSRLPVTPELLARLARGDVVFETLAEFGGEPTRLVSLPVEGHAPLRGVQVAGSLDDVNHVLRAAGGLFVAAGLALMVAVGVAGALVTRRALGAIDDEVEQAHGIGDTNLARRLPHPGTDDEIGRLVATLNEMLDRIEHGFEAQRRFTADASHELRSPLSRLRTELDVALRRPRSPAEYVETLHSCLEEVGRLTRLVEELLVLARLDAGQERVVVVPVALDTFVDDVVRRAEPVALERGLRIDVDPAPSLTVNVSPNAAGLVLANVLDNAVKFSNAGVIRISFAVEAHDAVIRIADQGPGIPPGDRPYLFERFYRGTAAQSGAPGAGLGLALSRAILNVYGGRIDADDVTDGGAVFAVRLPRADRDVASARA